MSRLYGQACSTLFCMMHDTLWHPSPPAFVYGICEVFLVPQFLSMKKMNEKPGHVRPANDFYAKLNALMFVPQKELSGDQVYWLSANEIASQASKPTTRYSFVSSTEGSCDQQALDTDRIQLKDTITSLRIQLDGLKVEHVSLKRRESQATGSYNTCSMYLDLDALTYDGDRAVFYQLCRKFIGLKPQPILCRISFVMEGFEVASDSFHVTSADYVWWIYSKLHVPWAEAVATGVHYSYIDLLLHRFMERLLWNCVGKETNLQYFRVFGILCYPSNDTTDETVHVAFDELTEGLSCSKPVQASHLNMILCLKHIELELLQYSQDAAVSCTSKRQNSLVSLYKELGRAILFHGFDDDEVVRYHGCSITPANVPAATDRGIENANGSPSQTVISEGALTVTESSCHQIPLT
ncbi:hypothetical protein Tco_0556271 [Tanacetum coccineum]